MSNQLGFLTADLACVRGGFVKVAMNDMLTVDEHRHIVTDSGATAIVAGESFTDTAGDLLDGVQTLEHVVVLSGTAPTGMAAAGNLLKRHSAEELRVSVDPGDVALFQYTGGTTGKPKGARHTQYGIATNLHAHVVDLDVRHGGRCC